MDSVATFLHRLPELCLFLAIVLGHLIGRIHFKGVGFGAVVGTLLAGIAIGILAKPDLPRSAALGVLLPVPVFNRLFGRPAVLWQSEERGAAADRTGRGRGDDRPGHGDWRHDDLWLR
jgi:hypothetical protein